MYALTKTIQLPVTILLVTLASANALAMNNQELEEITLQRLSGDRTGACFAVALIDKGEVNQAFTCADPTAEPGIDANSAFEIGSITKTMTGTLLAGLIAQGKASLDDPLQEYLPANAQVPEFERQAIRLRHIVTHTSGLPALPPGINNMDPQDPYARINEQQLIESLAQSTLERAPGSQYAYSNYATMLLSWAISRRAEQDFATLVDEQIFKPLDMQGAFVQTPPAQVHQVQGHIQSGMETPPWTFYPELAGVGGVKATLDDMVRYAEAQLSDSLADEMPALAEAIEMSHQPVSMPADASDASDAGDAGDAGDCRINECHVLVNRSHKRRYPTRSRRWNRRFFLFPRV